MKIKTIDVTAKEWFDHINGSSYFSMNITINLGMKTEKSFFVPMQYGYGDHYRDQAFKFLQDEGIIKPQDKYLSYWRFYEENKIIARHTKHENCLKRELKF